MDRVAVMLSQMMLVTVLLSSCLVRSDKTKERRPLTSTLTPSTLARSPSSPSEELKGAGGRTVTLRTRLGQEAEQWPIREMIAILGGVLGFWGGVGLMGTIFLLVLVTQRCCSRRSVMEKKEAW